MLYRLLAEQLSQVAVGPRWMRRLVCRKAVSLPLQLHLSIPYLIHEPHPRNQHLIHSIPIGHYYTVRAPSASGNPDWVSEFEWNGTIDWSPLLSVNAALDFRTFCGGEERINAYCHALAIDGGEEVARILGTETMRNKAGEGELVANMVCFPLTPVLACFLRTCSDQSLPRDLLREQINVRLPIDPPSKDLTVAECIRILNEQKNLLQRIQIEQYKTMAPGFMYAFELASPPSPKALTEPLALPLV